MKKKKNPFLSLTGFQRLIISPNLIITEKEIKQSKEY